MNIATFNEIFEILKNIYIGLSAAKDLSEKTRQEMKDAIADTAELIDETLTILKQHLSTLISELKFGDRIKAENMIGLLNSYPAWEDKYRSFQLCTPLREATYNLEKKGLYQYLNKVSLGDASTIQQRMRDYLGGEVNAAHSIAKMLNNLSVLDSKVSTDPLMVIQALEQARNEVSALRQAFIEIEIQIRDSI